MGHVGYNTIDDEPSNQQCAERKEGGDEPEVQAEADAARRRVPEDPHYRRDIPQRVHALFPAVMLALG